ncbi:MAG: Asp-tRNA(Asn)/Glu-tRNA(Gln) amidotransferase subunit GatA [Deltaproteobacteria bacterium]|nr:Asp-tRNA(Asn)/Glu-tRNA(Gln) amidotransferase subunit GatA [Deltaproteobacteria bacterium]
MGLIETRDAIACGDRRARDVCDEALRAIETRDVELGAFLHVDAEGAGRDAERIDAVLARGERPGDLAGVPIAVKDVIVTRGLPTTCGSRILDGFIPPYDATVIARLRAAGAVLIGKTNCDEFAMGSSNENSAYRVARNPWDTTRVPGGSSGGSAVAVAANMCAASLGSDTGGSIRQPASLAGVVGLKPTYGRVSRYGLVAFASSLDQVGPFARAVRDVAELLTVIAGHDPLDSTSVDAPVPHYSHNLRTTLKGVRVGVPREYFVEGIDAEVERAVRGALGRLKDLGATIHDVSLPHTPYALGCYYLIATAEASSNLARYDGIRFGFRAARADGGALALREQYTATRERGFGDEVKRRIMLGTFALSSGYYDAYYLKAQKVRALIQRDFDAAFREVDVIATPTSPTAAWKLGAKVADPLQMYLADIYTVSCNLAGNCGVSVPCGFTSENLPIGLQILGPAFAEERILSVAHAYEQSEAWRTRVPPHPETA